MHPVKIKVKENEFLDVLWSDGKEKSIKLTNLRHNCPCAICNAEKDDWGKKYIPIFTKDQLTINKISIVGPKYNNFEIE